MLRIGSWIAFILTCVAAHGQFVVSSNTSMAIAGAPDIVIESSADVIFANTTAIDWGSANVDLHLFGSGRNLSTATLNTIGALVISGGDYSVQGKWIVKDNIDFTKGNLITPSTFATDRIVYEGPDLSAKTTGIPSAISFVVGPFFIRGQSGTLTFPVGNSSGYFPAKLNSVTDPNSVVGLECVLGDPQIPADSLTADIGDVYTSWYWRLGVLSRGTFSGSTISLSTDLADAFFAANKEQAVVIEKDSVSYINELGGISNNAFVTSTRATEPKGIYALAGTKDVSIKIHKIITPNSDGQNETLVIEGLDLYPSNKVMLLDRWGAVYFEKENFQNYSTSSPQQGDFDYTKLNNGNYICIVQYTDAKGAVHKIKPQMISVLK